MTATATAIWAATLLFGVLTLVATFRLLVSRPTSRRLRFCDVACVVFFVSPLGFLVAHQASPATLLLAVLGLDFAVLAYAFDPNRAGRGDGPDEWRRGGPPDDDPEPPWWPEFEREFRRATSTPPARRKPYDRVA